MNHKITQIFVPDSQVTSGATSALGKQDLMFANSSFTSLGSGTLTPVPFYIAMGSGDTKFGSFKSSLIKPENIISVVKTSPDTSVAQQITSVKPSGTFSCDEEYVLTLKIDEYWSKGIYQPMIQESVRVKTACCDTCSGGCDALPVATYLEELVDKVNASPLLSKYVLASYNGEQEEILIEGKALDEFGNACVPDAVPYVFNLVRFKAIVHAGPYNTQDFDIEDFCASWTITNTQEIKYPIGVGPAIAELERHYFANNLPATHEARRYWNPIYNNDSDKFLFVDKTATYTAYEITYLDPSPEGFEKKTRNVHSALILVATGAAYAAALEVDIEQLTGVTL